MYRKLACFLVLAGLLAGCNGSNTQTNLNPLVPVVTPLRLYVANDANPGAIAVYNLPIGNTSTPAFTMTNVSANPLSVADDPLGNLAVGFLGGTISYYTPPLGAATAPAATWNNGSLSSAFASAFLNANNTSSLFVTTNTAVNRYNPPFSNSTTAATTTSNGITGTLGVGFDVLGSTSMYVVNNVGTSSQIKVYASPYTGAATVTTPLLSNTFYRKIAVYSQILVVADVSGTTGKLDVYTLPLTSTSLPAFSITAGVNVPEAVAFDPGGTLYVGNLGNSTVTVFSQSLSATSTPLATLTVGGGTWAIFGIAVGP